MKILLLFLRSISILAFISTPSIGWSFTRVIAVGTNHSFDRTLDTLQFAEEDARKFALAMKTVGMVPNLKISTVINPTVQEFRQTLSLLAKDDFNASTKAQGKSKLIFFFSGHSDENGLHFNDGMIPKDELHAILSRAKHETKIAILDSCFSGALVAKGVKKSESFDVPMLDVDEPSGSIYLTSSSSSQFAYESDALRGSVFSHHLLAGMYGDGDLNKDGIVTIDELYQYVYKNTKWHALTLPHKKTQDPEISSKLRGQGAVVLSYPVELDSIVSVDQDISGVMSIAAETGYQIFSIQKVKGQVKQVKMPPGKYKYSIVDGGKAAQGTFVLASQKTTLLASKNLTWVEFNEQPRGKGTSASLVKAAEANLVPVKIQQNEKNSKTVVRYGVGAHSDIQASDIGPYLGASVRKEVWLRKAPWFGVAAEGRFGVFQTTGDSNTYRSYEYENTVGSLQAIGFLNIGKLDIGFGYGQAGVHQVLRDDLDSKRVRKAALPVTTAIIGVHFPLKQNRTLGLDVVYEELDVDEVPGISSARNSYGVLVQYGM
jgi:hypothetical protein